MVAAPGGDPNVCRGNGGTKFHNPIADERHPDASVSEHTRVHNGDRHADTSILDGNVYPGIDPRTDDRHTYPNPGAVKEFLVFASGSVGKQVGSLV